VDIGIQCHVQKQIEVIVEDLKDAYEAWKQLQLGNQVSPPEEHTERKPRFHKCCQALPSLNSKLGLVLITLRSGIFSAVRRIETACQRN
jgi:hypothetical protein